MTDQECVRFLQWALPRLQLHWPGFRKVRRQVCRRIQARIEALKLTNVQDYQAYLEANAREWACLERLCRITISHFYRDRAVFELLQRSILPAIVSRTRQAGRSHILAWSAGCASGEEPYTLNLLWRFGPWSSQPDLSFRILATDIDLEVLRRARQACYGKSSLKQLPESWLVEAFTITGGQYVLEPTYRGKVLFVQHDVRQDAPAGPFDLLLCRNLVFTYFGAELQRNFTRRARAAMTPGGVLVIGASETLPDDTGGFVSWPHSRGVYLRQPDVP